jgi:hypothetical protein
MSEENLIPANEFCLHHNIEISFIYSLQEFGLIEITIKDEQTFLSSSQLNELEKLMRLHYELDINFEGMDAIINLLRKLQEAEEEMSKLKDKLRLYEIGE